MFIYDFFIMLRDLTEKHFKSRDLYLKNTAKNKLTKKLIQNVKIEFDKEK